VIRVDEDDTYQLMDMSPMIKVSTLVTNQSDVDTYILQLNNDNDIGKFTTNMRKIFQNNV